jgi:4-amino-4-deoxychorismate lyase
MLYCSVNGQQTNQIDVRDRALQYGDGLFTTALIKEGQIQLLNRHLARLKAGSEALQIELDLKLLEVDLVNCAKSYQEAVLKVTLSAGSGGRGYSRVGVSNPTIIIQIFDFPEHYHQWQIEGIELGVAKQKLGHTSVLAGLKHLNRLEQVFIRQELDNLPVDDVLVLDIYDHLIEASCGNVFWCIADRWFTAKITHAGVSGIMRNFIVEVLPSIQEVEVGLSDLDEASAIVVTNSVMQMVPVKQYLNKSLSVEIAKSFINTVNEKSDIN